MTLKDEIISRIQDELKDNSEEAVRESAQRFFKEEASFHGVRSQVVKGMAKKYFREVKGLDKDEIFSLCETLLQLDYGEEAYIAFEWAYYLRKLYESHDILIFEDWIRKYVNTWAKCDTLCNHAVGSFLESYPDEIGIMKTWARSENRWLRRAGAVSLILPARKGMFLPQILEIADMLLQDEDDMVQKGFGWMLKEASKKHQQEVFEYIMEHKAVMPRTALRYAIEKMPRELKEKAMEKP